MRGLVAAWCVLAAGPAFAQAGDEPRVAVVRELQDGLIESMKQGDSRGYEQRFAELAPVVEDSHHFGLIARVVAGRFWNDFTAEEKAAFERILFHLAVANLTSNFDNYHDQRFEMVEARGLRRGQFLVRTELRRKEREDVRFDYILADVDGTPGIINVVVDGVSDLALKRAEYQSVLEKRGFPGLMNEIRKQIDEMGGAPDG